MRARYNKFFRAIVNLPKKISSSSSIRRALRELSWEVESKNKFEEAALIFKVNTQKSESLRAQITMLKAHRWGTIKALDPPRVRRNSEANNQLSKHSTREDFLMIAFELPHSMRGRAAF